MFVVNFVRAIVLVPFALSAMVIMAIVRASERRSDRAGR
jgi:hypothetical protein